MLVRVGQEVQEVPRRVGAGQLEIVPIDAGRRADFYRLHGDRNDAGWCACAAWWVPTWDGWADRAAAENHEVRDALFARGEHDGLLAYTDGEPVGWCQLGPRDRLAKLTSQLRLEPDPGAWAVTCFLVAPAWRGGGVAQALLAAAAARARHCGAARLEAFPRRGEGLAADDLWNGPEPLFRAVGFVVARDDAARPVLRLEL